jgi:hypothetical protein
MTLERIDSEWREALSVLRPDLRRLLALWVSAEDGETRSLGDFPASALGELCRSVAGNRRKGTKLPPPDFEFVVLKLLVYAWATRRGAVTTRWLTDTAGCSYPTVATALKRLGSAVERQSDRRLALRAFPRDEWSRALANADRSRSTLRLADRSGQPRSAESLLGRLQQLRPEGVALGGVAGARHYEPAFDLMGLPRLDVSVHSPDRWPDLSFLEALDPGLAPTGDTREPARLVVHFVRHADPLFEGAGSGLPVADPVECLLDLHEARLESQASEFLEAVRKGWRVQA